MGTWQVLIPTHTRAHVRTLAHSLTYFYAPPLSLSPKVVVGLKEELSVLQSDFSRLQQEMDCRVLAGGPSTTGPGTPGKERGAVAPGGHHSGTVEHSGPPNEQRSSGEVGLALTWRGKGTDWRSCVAPTAVCS